MKEYYLDNAATTRPMPEVVEVIDKVLSEDWGNPSSLHKKGHDAELYLKHASEVMAKILKVETESVYFTSCATESINTALLGAAMKKRKQGRHILTVKGEHAATRETLKRLKENGFEIEAVENGPDGKVLLDSLKDKLREDTILFTCLHVNNETGVIQPIEEIGALLKSQAPEVLFHVDATQSFCKLPIYPKKYGIDMLSASAHKINGPKGIGLMYVRRDLHLPALLTGGGQQSHFRSGTENVPYIAGFAVAAETLWNSHEEVTSQMAVLKKTAAERLTSELNGVKVNGPAISEGVPYILNLQIDGVRSEVLLHALEDHGVYVSSGSACSSNKPTEKSPALSALGLNKDQIDHSLRVSLDRYSTMEDVEALITAVEAEVPMLRRFVRK